MKKIYIYGLGKGKKILERCLLNENIQIIAYIDNYKSKEIDILDNIPVIAAKDLDNSFDFIIVTLMQYENVRNELIEIGVPINKIVCFFSFNDVNVEKNWGIIDIFKWHSELMWKDYTEKTIPTINNYGYEFYADKLTKEKQIPNIISYNKTVQLIKENKKCIARFGDNEFELILGRRRTNYQGIDTNLSIRLKEVLNSNLNNLLIAIADNYGSLDKYTDEAALAIRQYLGNGTREEHMQLLDMNKTYYDAYLSRPYIIYKDKAEAKNRFGNIKEIWNGQDLLIVEGEHTRFGVGNDLLSNANSVERILTLDKDCFNVYSDLLECVKEYGKQKIVLIILGPTATVMAYDLAKQNYWALDIGQFDVEYEWYLRQAKQRCEILYKTVSEVAKYEEVVTDNNSEYIQKYQNEIIKYVK